MRKLVHTASFAWTANLFVNRLQFVTFIRGKTTEWCPSFFLPKQLTSCQVIADLRRYLLDCSYEGRQLGSQFFLNYSFQHTYLP